MPRGLMPSDQAGLLASLPAGGFPILQMEQWHTTADRFHLPFQTGKWRVSAAGPAPICPGFSFSAPMEHLNGWNTNF
jgi:hypothetical protein